jgi:hypothetical protein
MALTVVPGKVPAFKQLIAPGGVIFGLCEDGTVWMARWDLNNECVGWTQTPDAIIEGNVLEDAK